MPNHSIFKKKLEKIFEIYRKATNQKSKKFNLLVAILESYGPHSRHT